MNIIAVEIGHSRITATAAVRTPEGRLQLIGSDSELTPAGAMKNGQIVRPNDVVASLNKALRQLENRLPAGNHITKFYAGINCRSLSLKQVEVARELDSKKPIDDDILDDMRNEAFEKIGDDYAVISTSEEFALDLKAVKDPIDKKGNLLNGNFSVIYAKDDCLKAVNSCKESMNNFKFLTPLPTPLAVSCATASIEDKEAGCAVLYFGTGCTSVAVYTQGKLAHIGVVPLGRKHIVADLTTLGVNEKTAESLITYWGQNFDKKVSKSDRLKLPNDENGNERLLSLSDMINICNARFNEIVAYAMQQVQNAVNDVSELEAGIIASGKLMQISNANELLEKSSGMRARIGDFSQHIEKNNDSCRHLTAQTIGLLLMGNENCFEEKVQEPKKPSGKKGGKDGFIKAINNLFGSVN